MNSHGPDYETVNRYGTAKGRPPEKRKKVANSYNRIQELLNNGALSDEDKAVYEGIMYNRHKRLQQLGGEYPNIQRRIQKQKIAMLLRSNKSKVNDGQNRRAFSEFIANRHKKPEKTKSFRDYWKRGQLNNRKDDGNGEVNQSNEPAKKVDPQTLRGGLGNDIPNGQQQLFSVGLKSNV